MKMNNVIFVVVDSLCQDSINNDNANDSTTPYLNSIKDNCIEFDHVYSQGPYTEAGTIGLLCSEDSLYNQGYLSRFDKHNNFITKVFKDRGYSTNVITYSNYLFSSQILKSIDNIVYTNGFDFDVFWNQKIKYYCDLFNNNELCKSDYKIINNLMLIIFESWEDFLSPIKRNEKNKLLIPFCDNYDFNKSYKLLQLEKTKFLEDSTDYMNNLFIKERNHDLFKIPKLDSIIYNNKKTIKKTLKKHKRFVLKTICKQFYYILKNQKPYYSISTKKDNSLKNNFSIFINRQRSLLLGFDLLKMKSKKVKIDNLSAKTQIDCIVDTLINSKAEKNFILTHLEEPHYFNTFFSLDSDDDSILEKEFDYANEYVDSVKSNYRGSLMYDLSVRYVDKQIETLCNKLSQKNLLKDTLLVITADHGSSYKFFPYRSTKVLNYHYENFHIPFILYNKDIKHKTISTMSSNCDILPTVLDYLDEPTCLNTTGNSIFNNKSKNWIFLEYMGGGCPDLIRKTVWLGIRNNNYLICYKGLLKDSFDEKNIVEIYDLKKDILELKNIKNIRNPEILMLFEKLKYKLKSIKKSNNEILLKE